MLIGALLGLLIGAVLGLTGAGGGIFAVPALVFGLGMDIRQAAPVALLTVGAAALLGALQGLREGIVRYKAAMLLAGAGALTAPLGIWLAHWTSPRELNHVFVAVMLVVAYRMFWSSRRALENGESAMEPAKACKVSRETGRFVWNLRTTATLGGIGIVSGLATGMLGVGGGFIIVPALAHFTELKMHSIVATSLMGIALLSAVTVSIAWSQGMALGAPAWTFVLAALAGMAGGRVLAPRIPAQMLQRIFSITCVAVAALMLLRNDA